jgi:hypothetical protein
MHVKFVIIAACDDPVAVFKFPKDHSCVVFFSLPLHFLVFSQGFFWPKKNRMIILCIVLALLAFALLLAFCTNNESTHNAPLQVSELGDFVRNLAVQKSRTLVPVPILSLGQPLYNGLFVMHAGQKSAMFELARLALELKPGFTKVGHSIGAYKFRNEFEVITSDLPDTPIEFVQLLAKKTAFYICKDHLLCPLVSSHGDWRVYGVQERDVCVSQLIFDAFYKFCELEAYPDTIYYVTSPEREDEVREAYQNDQSFVAPTVTGIIHACVLKSMFPKMKIVIEPTDESLFSKASEFYQVYFSS